MKKTFVFLAAAAWLVANPPTVFAGPSKSNQYEAKGEITSVDPLYHRITIKHGMIKGLSGADETEFFVRSNDLLKNIHRRDLVEFTLTEQKGEVLVDKLVKTGVAEPVEETKVGQVVQDVLVGTGEVAKGITSPIAPAHEVMSGAVDATTTATGSVLEEKEF